MIADLARVAIVAFLAGIAFAYLAFAWPLRRWRRRRARREMALVEALIAHAGHRPRFEGHDDGLRLRTQARREAAGRIRVRANRVDAGERVGAILKMADRK